MLSSRTAEDSALVCLHALNSMSIYEDTELAISVFNLLSEAIEKTSNETKQKVKDKLERIVTVCESMGTRFIGDTVILKGLCTELLDEMGKKIESKRQLIYF